MVALDKVKVIPGEWVLQWALSSISAQTNIHASHSKYYMTMQQPSYN